MSMLPRSIEPNNRRWMILAFLMALCFISHFNRASMTSAGDERIMGQFNISPQQMGVIYTAFLVVYTLFMIPGGWLIDRRGPRFALTCMGIGSALFCAVTGAIGFGWIAGAQIWFTLFMVRSLMGMTSAPLHPGAARSVGNWFPGEQKPLANGLITGASILAYAVVHPVFGGLIDRVDWPIAFVITGFLTALLAVAWRIWVKDGPENHEATTSHSELDAGNQHSPSEPTRTFSRDRNLWLLTLSYAAVGYFQYLFFYWLHFYFDSVLKMDKTESRVLAGIPNLAMALCMPLGGWLTNRARRRLGQQTGETLVPKVGMIVSSLFLVCGIFSADKTWIVVWFTLALGTLGLCEASFWTVAVELGRSRGGTSAAIMNTGGNGIGLLAPMMTPWIGTHLGWGWGIGVGAVVGLLGAACWFGITVKEKEIILGNNRNQT